MRNKPGTLIVVLFLFLGVCGAQVQGESEPQNSVVAIFEGGEVTLLDLDGWAAMDYSKVLRGTRIQARARAERSLGGRRNLTELIAFNRILSAVGQKHGIPLDVTEQSKLQVEKEKILGSLYLSRVAEQAVAEAQEKYRQRCWDHFQENIQDYQTAPTVTFRFILAGIPVDSTRSQQLWKRPKKDWDQSLLTPREKEDYLALANSLRERCKNGEDFLTLAKQYSAVTEADRRGRLIGPVSAREYASSIASVLETLAPGEISPPIETPFGFFIFRCEDVQPSRTLSFEEALPHIEARIGRFQSSAIVREVRNRITEEHPFVAHSESLSRDMEKADAVVLEGSLAFIRNRDIFRPDLAEFLEDQDPDAREILKLARLMYWRRVEYLLALQAGIEQEETSRRAVELLYEQIYSTVVLAQLKQGIRLEGLPKYEPPLKGYLQSVLEKFQFRYSGDESERRSP